MGRKWSEILMVGVVESIVGVIGSFTLSAVVADATLKSWGLIVFWVALVIVGGIYLTVRLMRPPHAGASSTQPVPHTPPSTPAIEDAAFATGQAAAFRYAFDQTVRYLADRGPTNFRAEVQGATLRIVSGEAQVTVASARVSGEGVVVSPPDAAPFVEGVVRRIDAVAHAEIARATASAHDASVVISDEKPPENTVGLTGRVSHVVIPGQGSPTLNQVGYETQGRRHFAFGDWKRRPNAIRFSVPIDRLLRPADLPAEIPSGKGRLVVEKFYADGVVIDEDGTVGDPVGFVGYFDD